MLTENVTLFWFVPYVNTNFFNHNTDRTQELAAAFDVDDGGTLQALLNLI